jgi:hypothetical protein
MKTEQRLRKWNWDINDLRSALLRARIEKVGKMTYEAYVKDKRGRKKILCVSTGDEIFLITGREGK